MTRGKRNDAPCVVDGCETRPWGAGLCQRHYTRLRRTGSVALKTEQERFWGWVDKSQSCWVWQGGMTGSGYGSFSVGGKSVAAHIFAYQDARGAVPVGLEVDHLCRNRACVRPDHLEAVTHQVNVIRGTAPTAINAAKTHCGRGHEFTPENTIVKSKSRRACRACKKLDDAKRYRARKAAGRG